MNILLMDGLPEDYRGVPISADFRNMIQVDVILRDPGMSDMEKTVAALNQLYPEIPKDTNLAIEGLEWFFSRGKTMGKDKKESRREEKRAFDFDVDANTIYSSFYAAYGLSLTATDFLHWWEFMALFEGLPEDSAMKQIIYYRTADVGKMSKSERKRVLKMRKLFALDEPAKKALTVEEIERNMKDDIARRYEEAERWAQQQKIKK